MTVLVLVNFLVDGRPNSSAAASAGGSAAGRSLDAPRTAEGQGVSVDRVGPQIALLRASGRLRQAEAAVAAATAGESEGNTGLLEVIESDFPSLPNSSHSPNSRLGSLSSECESVLPVVLLLLLHVFAPVLHLLLCLLLLHIRMLRSCMVHVNFRPAGGVRGQVAGSLSRK